MKLYGMKESGNCWKAATILALIGHAFKWMHTDANAGDTQAPAFLAVNPIATAVFGVPRGGERPKPAFWLFSGFGGRAAARAGRLDDGRGNGPRRSLCRRREAVRLKILAGSAMQGT